LDKLTLGIVDQSPMRRGGTAAEALRESVAMAQAAERLGYARYWVAEHHNAGTYTGTSPEVLIGQIAANTSTIRVGSGGVMLPHYSALEVAEQFRVLDAFYPGRIDLGIGRAPGSDQRTAAALVYPRMSGDPNKFPQMVMDLLSFLEGTPVEGNVFAGASAQPGPPPSRPPDVWLLGSTGEHGPAVAELYRQEFKPSKYLSAPRLNVTVQSLCAPTEEEALFLASSRNLNKVFSRMPDRTVDETGRRVQGLWPPEEASRYPLSAPAREYLESLTPSYIDGSPSQVRDKIIEVAERYGTNDVNNVTPCYAYDARVRSISLIAEAFGIGKR